MKWECAVWNVPCCSCFSGQVALFNPVNEGHFIFVLLFTLYLSKISSSLLKCFSFRRRLEQLCCCDFVVLSQTCPHPAALKTLAVVPF